jgi:predicted DNA-binding transcriptional regulator AlpA
VTNDSSATLTAPDQSHFMKGKDILALLRVSRETLRTWSNDGRFPKPVALGVRLGGRGNKSLRWRREAVMAWLAEKEAATNAAD